MKRNIESELKTLRAYAKVFVAMGILFFLGSAIFFIKRETWKIFPRMDIAWIGFLIVGIILISMGVLFFKMSKDKSRYIEGSDEMELLINYKTSTLAYYSQTLLLAASFFLMSFMGYLNIVSAITIAGIIAVSAILSTIYEYKMRKHGVDVWG